MLGERGRRRMWTYRLTFFFARSFSFSPNILSAIPFLNNNNNEREEKQSVTTYTSLPKEEKKGRERKEKGFTNLDLNSSGTSTLGVSFFCPYSSGFSSCLVREGRELYGRGFLHSNMK